MNKTLIALATAVAAGMTFVALDDPNQRAIEPPMAASDRTMRAGKQETVSLPGNTAPETRSNPGDDHREMPSAFTPDVRDATVSSESLPSTSVPRKTTTITPPSWPELNRLASESPVAASDSTVGRGERNISSFPSDTRAEPRSNSSDTYAEKTSRYPRTAQDSTISAASLPLIRVPWKGATITTPPQPEHDLVLSLAPGVREPIAFAEPHEELTPEQAEALGSISNDFSVRIDQAATLPDEDLAEVWSEEQSQADSLYRILFGDSAYNQKSAETALDAL